MPLFTVKQGGSEIEPGVYPVSLVKITGPKTVTAQRGPKAGQDIELFDWTFSIMDPTGRYDGEEIDASTSTASGPKSKMYAFLTALLGGRPPAVGQTFEANDLIGKIALATISKTEDGWPRIDNLGAMPAAMLAQGIAAATGAPLASPPAAAGQPAREAVAAGAAASSDLPF